MQDGPLLILNGRVVLITGAAGALGRACAEATRRLAARTVCVDRSQARLDEAFPGSAASPDALLIGDVDLLDARSAAEVAAKVLHKWGRIDGLIHTVGGFRGGKEIREEDIATWDSLFETNVKTTLNMCRAVAPVMCKQRAGSIVTVASRAALAGAAGLGAYSATKASVVRLTESIADEVKGMGVRANCVLPGTLDTPQNRNAMPDADASLWVQPRTVADVIAFLLSDMAGGVNGACIPIYGRG